MIDAATFSEMSNFIKSSAPTVRCKDERQIRPPTVKSEIVGVDGVSKILRGGADPQR